MNANSSVGEFGTFDVENYGDLLYPVIFEKMFQQREPTRSIRKFSLQGSKSLQLSRYCSEPISRLLSSSGAPLQSLVIGGGDILRTDWDRMASHYYSVCVREKYRYHKLDPRRLFRRKLDLATHTSEFRKKWMNYPAAGPFILDPAQMPGLRSIAYCSCGVPFPFETAVRPAVASAFNQSAFINVRDQSSRNKLLEAGVTREIHVAPDLIVALSDFFDPAAGRKTGRNLLAKHGLDLNRKILCVQTNPQPPENTAEILGQLQSYQQRTGCEIALLPVARCHGDYEFLQHLSQSSGGSFKYVEIDSIFEIISAIAACDLFLGTSLHGNITAFSFGIPHVFGPIAVSKCEGFLDIVNLPLDLKLNSWSEINAKLDPVANAVREILPARLATAKHRVHEVFDLMVKTVAAPAPFRGN
jgi:hypothetical protein